MCRGKNASKLILWSDRDPDTKTKQRYHTHTYTHTHNYRPISMMNIDAKTPEQNPSKLNPAIH